MGADENPRMYAPPSAETPIWHTQGNTRLGKFLGRRLGWTPVEARGVKAWMTGDGVCLTEEELISTDRGMQFLLNHAREMGLIVHLTYGRGGVEAELTGTAPGGAPQNFGSFSFPSYTPMPALVAVMMAHAMGGRLFPPTSSGEMQAAVSWGPATEKPKKKRGGLGLVADSIREKLGL